MGQEFPECGYTQVAALCFHPPPTKPQETETPRSCFSTKGGAVMFKPHRVHVLRDVQSLTQSGTSFNSDTPHFTKHTLSKGALYVKIGTGQRGPLIKAPALTAGSRVSATKDAVPLSEHGN